MRLLFLRVLLIVSLSKKNIDFSVLINRLQHMELWEQCVLLHYYNSFEITTVNKTHDVYTNSAEVRIFILRNFF